VTAFVIDASVAIKWVVEEPGTAEALALRRARLHAPDLLVAECANILWKKVRLGQLTPEEASLAAQLLERADMELAPMRKLMREATALAIEFEHPAYDFVYLCLALSKGCAFVTADERLLRKLAQAARTDLHASTLTLAQAAGSV
jgi:predicted nucleic acid-binding protein